MTEHKLIGTTEQVYLPDIGKTSFAAKIDTGADSSAIWASDIEQVDDTLSYKFFAPGSANYTGETFQTNRFKLTSVTNSFGHEEVRYKVRLRIKIGKIIYTSWFTLANRSRNSYPILIGKNFLKNRFVVDVSKKHLQSRSDDLKVLIISAKPKEIADFLVDVKKQNKLSIEYTTVRFEDLLFDINGNDSKIINTDKNTDVSDYSLIYVKSHWNYPELAAALAEYLIFKSIPFFDQELRNYTSRSKLSESMKLTTHGIAIPRSFAGYPKLLRSQSEKIIKDLGFPFVLKAASADRGKDNYLVSDINTFNQLIDNASAGDIYIVQKFVPSDGFYRINVFGKDARLVVYRSRYPHNDPLKDHLNKPFGGVNAEMVPTKSLNPDLAQLAVRASIYMKREIAGVDIIQDKNDGKCYILEVNSSPQLRSGSFIDEKASEFARFIDKELKR